MNTLSEATVRSVEVLGVPLLFSVPLQFHDGVDGGGCERTHEQRHKEAADASGPRSTETPGGELRAAGRHRALDRPPLWAMEHLLYEHFYEVLWKLLVRHSRRTRDGGRKPAESTGTDACGKKEPGYVTAFAGCKKGDCASTIMYNFACSFASYSSKSTLLGAILNKERFVIPERLCRLL